MSIKIQELNHNFHPFYQDNFILIQFILEEFISTYQLTSDIKLLFLDRLDAKELFSSFPFLIQNLEQLIGSSLHQRTPSIFCWTQGPLTKLKQYCEQFSRNSPDQNNLALNLHISTHQAWLMAVNTLETINSLYTNSYTPNVKSNLILLPIKRSFQIFQIRFNQLCRDIPQILCSYPDNENVIYYLVRRKNDLSAIYGNDFLQKWFKWPKNSSNIISFLKNRYQSRGFKSLTPSIQDLLESELQDHSYSFSNSS